MWVASVYYFVAESATAAAVFRLGAAPSWWVLVIVRVLRNLTWYMVPQLELTAMLIQLSLLTSQTRESRLLQTVNLEERKLI